MNLLAKIALGGIAYNKVKGDFTSTKRNGKIGTVSNYDSDSFKIPNNGGL